jgi:hypothetical protein
MRISASPRPLRTRTPGAAMAYLMKRADATALIRVRPMGRC